MNTGAQSLRKEVIAVDTADDGLASRVMVAEQFSHDSSMQKWTSAPPGLVVFVHTFLPVLT